MKTILDEITYDAKFVKGHRLQPGWYKVLKIFILLAVICGYGWIFGLRKAILFVVVFLLLSLAVHLVYRAKTGKFTRNWMDFVIVEDREKGIKQGIGAVYYTWIFLNAAVAFLLSQVIA
jgi:Ca2+-dependent lipid-binding protein